MGKRNAGRTSDLEKVPEIGAFIVEAVALGSTIMAACDRAGIHESTVYRWVQKGEAPNAKDCYREFGNRLKSAVRERFLTALRSIKDQGERNWTANAWLLERTMPSFFGKETLRHELANIHAAIAAINKNLAAQGSAHQVPDLIGPVDLSGGLYPDLNNEAPEDAA
jgi:hypothetical protein